LPPAAATPSPPPRLAGRSLASLSCTWVRAPVAPASPTQ
jgi:hypothetical protein